MAKWGREALAWEFYPEAHPDSYWEQNPPGQADEALHRAYMEGRFNLPAHQAIKQASEAFEQLSLTAQSAAKAVADFTEVMNTGEKRDYRVLITGSRTWDREDIIFLALNECLANVWRRGGYRNLVIVHGDCPKGADRMAAEWVRFWPPIPFSPALTMVREEAHPANWKKHNNQAGFIRNQEMVDLGADLCLAFIKAKSNGATHCANAAEKAGIDTKRFELP